MDGRKIRFSRDNSELIGAQDLLITAEPARIYEFRIPDISGHLEYKDTLSNIWIESGTKRPGQMVRFLNQSPIMTWQRMRQYSRVLAQK
jgi:hypothetical protein